jgi:hypothetical protein
MKQNTQSGTTLYRGKAHESGEREPKGATSSDTSGERHVKVPKEDRESGHKGVSGEREPKGAKASDAGGERHSGIVGGVGIGKADMYGGRGGEMGKHDGRTGEFNTGKKEGSVYSHQRGKLGFTHKG